MPAATIAAAFGVLVPVVVVEAPCVVVVLLREVVAGAAVAVAVLAVEVVGASAVDAVVATAVDVAVEAVVAVEEPPHAASERLASKMAANAIESVRWFLAELIMASFALSITGSRLHAAVLPRNRDNTVARNFSWLPPAVHAVRRRRLRCRHGAE